MMSPWLGIALVLATLLGLLLLLRLYRRLAAPHPEVLRKLLHVGMGLVTLSFPWLFSAIWPVWVLAGCSLLMLAAVRFIGPLRASLGGVVDGVSRSSLGDFYFPISVALVFTLADRNPLLYVIPILVLTLADAVAALIGIFYGHRHYTSLAGEKSLEGSVAFFTVAFLSMHVPLLLFTHIGRQESLLIGIIIGLQVMVIEAIAWAGLDNLFIPLGTFVLLTGYQDLSMHVLLTDLLATLAWVAFVFIWRRRSTLNDAALMAAALVGYCTWALGGWGWLWPPLLMFLGYTILWPRAELLRKRPHDIHAVAATCLPGVLWLVLAWWSGQRALFFPYTAFYAAQLALIGISYYREVHQQMATPARALRCATKGWAVLFVPFVLLQGARLHTIAEAGIALVVLIFTVMIFDRLIPRPEDYSIERFPWLRQALAGFGVSLLCLLFGYFSRG